MKKQCLECSTEIMGRVDKKFCSDYCRNAYHNKVNKDSKNLIRNINNRLRKNYRVLDSYQLKEGKTRTTRTRLLDKGFDFDFITNLYTTKKGTSYYFVYDLPSTQFQINPLLEKHFLPQKKVYFGPH